MTDALSAWREERNRALMTLDLVWARRQCPFDSQGRCSDDITLLMSLHKARYDCRDIPDDMRLHSGEWLRVRGLQGMSGPLLPPGELPR